MKTEHQEQIHKTVDQVMPELTDKQRDAIKALCRAAYYMGYETGGADALINELNKTERWSAVEQQWAREAVIKSILVNLVEREVYTP